MSITMPPPFFQALHFTTYLSVGQRIYSNRLPLRSDTWHSCSFFCRYCFARAVERVSLARDGVTYVSAIGRVTPADMLAKQITKIFEKGIDESSFTDIALSRRWFIEIGTMGEPFLRDEQTYPSTYNMIQTAIDYDIPLYFTTKGGMLIWSEKYYEKTLELKRKIIDISITGINDEKAKFWEPIAPPPSMRLKLMERLIDDRADVVASVRPVIIGYTDQNFEAFIERLCQTGVKSIHLRTLLVCTPMLKYPFWRSFVNEYTKQGILEYAGGAYAYNDDTYLLPLFKRAEAIAEKYGVSVTGNHRLFFDIKASTSNKCDWDKFKDANEIKKALYPYHIITWATKVKQNKNQIQILKWRDAEKDIYAEGDEKLKNTEITIIKPHILLMTEEGFWRPIGKHTIKIGDCAKLGIWEGLPTKRSEGGYIRLMRHIYVIGNGKGKNVKGLRDEDENLIYTYIPPNMEKEFKTAVTKIGKTKYIDVNKLKEYVKIDN